VAGSCSFGLLNGGGTLIVQTAAAPPVEIDRVTYGASPTGGGRSLQVKPDKLDAVSNDDPLNWCPAPDTATYGTSGNKGSPGLVNPACP
jgi:hypothetical protein